MPNVLIAVVAALFSLLSTANAGPGQQQQPGPGQQHQSDMDWAKLVQFNVYCRYESTSPPATCYAGSEFQKHVSYYGREIEDDSQYPFNPRFQVECNGETVFNNGARRFTDEDGTRIQAGAGPYPAVLLPRRSLSYGRYKVKSVLELRDFTLEGSCFIYTGNP